ncbi:MAG UNVERIFIED_CONTAM: hypothetical protein LVR18_07695 [Planctomycetaceae bacterium]
MSEAAASAAGAPGCGCRLDGRCTLRDSICRHILGGSGIRGGDRGSLLFTRWRCPELLPESAIPAGVTGQNHHTQNASNRHRMTATPAMMRGRESVAGDRSGGGRLGGFGPETTAGADAAAGSETGADVGAAAVWEGLTDFAEREGVPGGFRTVGKASANDSAELLLAALTVV